MFAQSLPDLGMNETVLQIVKIIAAIGGAVAGWFVTDPLTRLAYRVSFKGAAPFPLLISVKTLGAIAGAAFMYSLVHFGGGGGLGWGPGAGGNPGKGPGQGGDKGNTVVLTKDGKSTPVPAKDARPNGKSPRTIIEIEILGGAAFKGEDRYFLVKKSDPALKLDTAPYALKELEDKIKDHHDKIQIKIQHTDDSTVVNNPMDPTHRLQKLASQYDIPTQGPKE